MSIIEPMLTRYGSTFLGLLVLDATTLVCESIYNNEDGIYGTILAQMMKKREIKDLLLIDELITCVEILPDWDFTKYDQLLAEREIELVEENEFEETAKIYYKKPAIQKKDGMQI